MVPLVWAEGSGRREVIERCAFSISKIGVGLSNEVVRKIRRGLLLEMQCYHKDWWFTF
jgi:hypothetical protein